MGYFLLVGLFFRPLHLTNRRGGPRGRPNLLSQYNMLLKFFLTCNKIGAFTLGGGYAMIPIMEEEFVDKNHWLGKQEFIDIMVVAQTTPGIFSIDMASHIGYKMKGVWGGIVGALGIAFPSIIVILLIAMFFRNFKDNPWVEKFFEGVRPVVVALIASPCFKMAKTANISWKNIWIVIVSCLLIWLLKVNPVWIIIVAGTAGFLYGKIRRSRK
jgi:chromate transporter